jgi:GTPase Era involved in 16S rRNA processing
VRRGLGTKDITEAERIRNEMNELLSNQAWWTPAARERAERIYDSRVVSAFYDYMTPAEYDFWGLRERIIPLPTPDNGYIRVLFVGTTGAGKTTVVRQLLGTEPIKERFPSTSAAKTTICDLEVVLAEGAFQAVITFLPKDRIQMYVEECVIAAVQAALDQRDTQDIARKLLEHSEQRFRLSYILGVLPSQEMGDDEEEDNEEDEQEEVTEQDTLSPQERQNIVTTLQEFLQSVRSLAVAIREHLTAQPDFLGAVVSKEDRDVLIQELLENELYKDDAFQQLIDDIVDAVEERFSFLQQKGHAVFERGGWPAYWTFESEDREEFLKTVNQFSSNYAPLFGRLLTPLVQGIRVSGPFRPAWRDEPSPHLVLMDGEGLGHTLDTATSLSTEVTSRFEKADAIVLVDSASQPMQATSNAVLKSVEAGGHAAKLLICFTHFDSVEGDNLPTPRAKRNHVRNSLENAITAIGREMGLRASAALSNAVKERIFFVSTIQKSLPPEEKATRAEFNKMVDALENTCTLEPPTEIGLVYDKLYLFSSIQRAVKSFHEAWQGRLGLTVQPSRYPEHWTRIKALSRRPARLRLDEYDTLRPVADLIRELSEQIRVFLMKPQRWQPADGSEEIQQAAIDSIARDVYARLHTFARKRLIRDHLLKWETAYTRWGTGSAKERAHDLESIYNRAAPIVGEITDDAADEFLASIVELVSDAVQAKGGQLW